MQFNVKFYSTLKFIHSNKQDFIWLSESTRSSGRFRRETSWRNMCSFSKFSYNLYSILGHNWNNSPAFFINKKHKRQQREEWMFSVSLWLFHPAEKERANHNVSLWLLASLPVIVRRWRRGAARRPQTPLTSFTLPTQQCSKYFYCDIVSVVLPALFPLST